MTKIGMCVRMEVAEDLPRWFCDSSLFPGEIALKVPVFAQKRVWTALEVSNLADFRHGPPGHLG